MLPPCLRQPDQASACIIDRHGQRECPGSHCLTAKGVDADCLVALGAVVDQDSIKRRGQRDSRVGNAGTWRYKGGCSAGAWRSAKGHCHTACRVASTTHLVGGAVGCGGRVDSGRGQVQRSLEGVGSS